MEQFYALQKARASLLNRLITRTVIKPSDEGWNSGSGGGGTTPHNDDTLFMDLEASKNYKIELIVSAIEGAGTGTDINMCWTFPTGTTLYLGGTNPHRDWVATAGSAEEVEYAGWQNVSSSPSPTIRFGTTNVAAFTYHVFGVISVAATPGRLQLQWCQAVANAANLTVKAGSSLSALQT